MFYFKCVPIKSSHCFSSTVKFHFIPYMGKNDCKKEDMRDSSVSNEDVYTLLTKIPHGKVSTYGDIARALGHPRASRAIGRILANNPNPISVPCHRVVKSNGEIGGFAFGQQKKREILEKEGIKFQNKIVKNFQEFRFKLTAI
jgi:methylated-DNA-[protein]-cysteine S-methyltransferase